MDFDFILGYVRTEDERNALINLLEEMLENNFRKDQDALPDSSFEKRASDIVYSEIQNRDLSNNREEIEKFLESILATVRSLPEIRISIAIDPTEDLIKRLKEWADANELSNVIFNIEVKSEIVAGAIIMSQNGEYANYSLSAQFTKFFSEKREEIFSLL